MIGSLISEYPGYSLISDRDSGGEKTNMASRFAKNISEAEISQIIDGAVPENTKKSTQFGLNVFRGKF